MKYTVSVENLENLIVRFKKEARFNYLFRVVPVSFIIVTLMWVFGDLSTIYIVFLFIIVVLIQIPKGIKKQAKTWQKNYSIELYKGILIQRLGEAIKEIELKNASIKVGKFGKIVVKNSSSTLIQRFFYNHVIYVLPEIDGFDSLKEILSNETNSPPN